MGDTHTPRPRLGPTVWRIQNRKWLYRYPYKLDSECYRSKLAILIYNLQKTVDYYYDYTKLKAGIGPKYRSKVFYTNLIDNEITLITKQNLKLLLMAAENNGVAQSIDNGIRKRNYGGNILKSFINLIFIKIKVVD